VYEVMIEALELARHDHQPTLVEALSYRLCDHTTADDATRYRDAQEYDEARAIEPLIRFKLLLENEYQWGEADDEALYEDCDQRVEKSVEVYQASADQATGEFFDHMFAELPTDLERQKKAWLDAAKHRG